MSSKPITKVFQNGTQKRLRYASGGVFQKVAKLRKDESPPLPLGLAKGFEQPLLVMMEHPGVEVPAKFVLHGIIMTMNNGRIGIVTNLVTSPENARPKFHIFSHDYR